MHAIRDTIENIKRNPFKSLLTFISVGLGVGVLIFAVSVNQVFSLMMTEKIEQDGLVLMAGNLTVGSDGAYTRVEPPEIDRNAHTVVGMEVEGVMATSPVFKGFFDELISDGERYQIRNFLGTNEDYDEVMNLEMLIGSFFTSRDVETGAKKAVISESTANMIFGSPEAAIGQILSAPSMSGGRDSERTDRFTPPSFEVTGVFSDVDELKRKAYGIGDIVAPLTSLLPGGTNTQGILDRFSTQFAVKVQNNDAAEAQIRESLARAYGDDISLVVWEGSLEGPSELLSETRKTITTTGITINLLGFILLISAAIGILSIMLVEILGKHREIAIHRALGASKSAIVRQFMIQSLLLTLISALFGLGLTILFSEPLTGLVSSIFNGIDFSDFAGSIIRPAGILVGFATALGIGGLFGTLPVLSVVRTPIAEAIRDV